MAHPFKAEAPCSSSPFKGEAGRGTGFGAAHRLQFPSPPRPSP
jgi:hypothetical protein